MFRHFNPMQRNIVIAVLCLGIWFAASSLIDKQNSNGFHFKTVKDETAELLKGINPSTKQLSPDALQARKDFFLEKSGEDSSSLPGTIPPDRLKIVGEELSKAISGKPPSGRGSRSSLDLIEKNSLKELNLSGEDPRVRTSPGGRILSVSGRFDLASFSSRDESALENSVTRFLEDHPKTFGLEGAVSVDVARAAEKGASGDAIIRMEKSLMGLPIWGEQIVVSVVDSEVRAVTGALRSGPGNLDTEALLTQKELETISAAHLKIPLGSFEITASERGVLSYGDRYSYTYKVKVYVNPAEVWELFVAPRGRRVVLKVSTIFTQSVPSSGIDLLGQSRSFNSFRTSEGDYIMVDRSYPIGSESLVATNIFDDVGERSYPYIRANSPDSGWDPAGVSAVANTKIIYDYFLSKHNRDSYDNQGTKMVSIANYQKEEGVCFDNAFWNGSQMTYGDGCFAVGGLFKNFAISLDVAGHEISHGVVQFTADLRYENQSGALNESYADIFGVSVDSEDWNIGEDTLEKGQFLRSFVNPASGLTPQPGHMDDFVFYPIERDKGGVHVNSGIQNRAFYLLAEGNAKEGLGLSIGRDDAEKIAYAALLKLTPNSEYTDSANQWFLEAELIFGTVSNQVTAVRQAWANVGIEITQTTEDSPGDSDDGSGSGEDSQPEEDGGPSRDIPIPPGDDVVIYLVAQDGSTGSGENPVDEQYDVMLYNSDQNPDGFVEEANLGPLNEFPAAYIRPAVATLPGERTLVLYVRDSTKQLYYTYSDEIGEPDYILDFGEGVSVKSVAVSRGGSRLAVVFSEYKAYIFVYDIVSEEWSTYDIREPNYIPDDPGTLVDRVDAINFDPQGGSLIFDYQVCRAELDTNTCTELWSIGLVKLSTGIVDFPFIELQDPNIDIANPRYSQKTYEAIVLDYIDFSNYEAEGKASSAVLALTSDGTSAIINPNQSESFDRALGYPSFVGEDESVLVQARFDDSIYLYSVPIDQDYQPSNESANSVIPFSAALSAAHVNVFVNTRTVLGINTESIELGEVIKGKEITAYFAIGNLGNSDILVTNVVPSSEEITTQLANTSLIPGEQKSFYVTVKTNNLDLGDYSGSISIEHDADNPAITLDISAVVTSGEEGSEDDLLAAPSNLSASDGADEASVFLTWSAVENADEYRVYWSDEEDGRKRRLTTIDYAPSNNNALSHTTGTDATFYYWVTGLNGEIESPYSNMDTGYAGEPRDPGDGSDGDGSDENSDSTAAVDFALNYSVSVSVFQGCAIEDSGVRCWGNTDWLDYTGYPSFSSPSQITSGSAHACVLDQNSVVCWGYNGNGETDVPALNNPYFVTSKYGISCALDESGVVCWGTNASGQTDVPSLSNPREVAIGVENACALDDNGVVCWGDDSRAVSTNIPETVNPSKLTMGDLHACVTDNDRVVCWGSGFSPSNSSSPTYEQPTLVNPRKLVAGGYHVCALDDHGLKCWGRNNESQLEIPILINPSSVYAAGQFGSCALDDNGLQCWGSEVSDTNSEKERSLKEFPSDLSFASSGQRVVTQYLQTTSASENITTLNVVNTSDRSQTFRGILRNGSGEKVGVDQPVLGTDIPAMGRLTLNSDDLEAIFGIEAWKGPAMLTIKGDSTFDLMSKLESPSGLVSNTNCIRDNRVLNLEGFDSNNMSYVRLINTGAKTTQAIKGTLYDGNGIVVGNANAELVAKLDPYQQTWINRNQLSSLVDAEWNGEGMLEVNARPGLKLLNLNFITDEATFFNFSCADKATLLAEPSSSSGPANIGRIYLQTTSTSQNVSLTHLVNTSDSGQQYTGTLYGSDGAQVGSADQPLHSGTIASKGRLILSSTDIESAFNISPWRGPAILEVKGDGLFELMTKLESPSGLISNTNCVRTGQVHNIGGFDQTDVTYVRFINIGDTPITNIRGSLYDDGGIVVGEANPVLVEELPAKSHVWRNRNQLSDTIGNTWNGTASLKIYNADSNLRLLNLNFINSETFFNFSCYETGQ